ncbi:hypothetical protein GCM10010174_18090 [Kutzneria viridogrisea]|uniref:Protein kinase domain-containing protein n=2 Tax=Kutzneria TaxID=43356 RepID=W5WFW2_9PSEU|nr:serine/threonine-protein kinase [Kutzneria albida]AHH99615.1 hypothetical protein KALB_6255 [Kutzneria albida DSM 43870]MBA8922829.1 serine/threonine-protein kinase [Kutzneria viridogrisea]
MSLLEIGQKISRNYTVERFLGQGAFAEVYRVKHRYLGRQAMKVFKRIGTVEEIEAMLGEAILLSKIGHPNIVRVFEADTVTTSAGQCGFFTMEYVAGGNLHRFLTSHYSGFVPVEVAVRILSQICEGLAVAHSEDPPIIHRDVTPQNVLIGDDTKGLRARVSDFGLAKRTDPLTLLASTKGTLAFKAPESLRDLRSDSCAGDVWAIGTIAYLVLTGKLPYEGADGPASFFGAPFLTKPQRPQEINPEIDDGLAEIVLHALEPDPAKRTPHAGAMADEFSQWRLLRGRTKQSERVHTFSRAPDPQVVPLDEARGRQLVGQALELGRQGSTLTEAIALLEQAFRAWPALRAEHERRLWLWRKGIVS